jgi:hypothetical protein
MQHTVQRRLFLSSSLSSPSVASYYSLSAHCIGLHGTDRNCYFSLQNRCNFRIQKNGGCNHMTCRCGHEICWKCGGDYIKNGQRGHNQDLFPSPAQYKCVFHPMRLSAQTAHACLAAKSALAILPRCDDRTHRTSHFRYCCNDAKMQAQRVVAVTGILTVGVAAAAIAAAGLVVYYTGLLTWKVVAAPPRAIAKARYRRRELNRRRRLEEERRQQGCACYFPLDGSGCLFCGQINP